MTCFFHSPFGEASLLMPLAVIGSYSLQLIYLFYVAKHFRCFQLGAISDNASKPFCVCVRFSVHMSQVVHLLGMEYRPNSSLPVNANLFSKMVHQFIPFIREYLLIHVVGAGQM